MDFVLNNHQQLVFTIEDDWWSEAKMHQFRRKGDYYIPIQREGIQIVSLLAIEPRIRLKGFNRRRLVRILKGLRKGSLIPPIEIIKQRDDLPYSYKLRDGFHRFYSSAAVGFTCIPALISEC